MSEGVHIYNTYQPWFDTDDNDNILFASVQGYGPKSSTRPGEQHAVNGPGQKPVIFCISENSVRQQCPAFERT